MTKEQFLQNHQADREKLVTTGVLTDTLLEFTHDVFLPAMSDLIDAKLDARLKESEHRMKSYIDDKLADYTSDIFKRLEKTFQKDRAFKVKVVDLFKKHHIGSPEEVAFLEGMLQGS